jgi:GntR family carbon starvation induced transcriptional regulator
MTEKTKKTKATTVLENLRYDIIHGVYPSGARLQMEDLKERYGVGYSPLREALFQLTTCGLVTIEEHCGFTVTPLTREELHDLYRTRMLLEIQALELAIANGDDQWEADVLANWHRFSKYLTPANKNKISADVWNDLQADYFNALVNACKSPWIMKLSQVLFDQSERYRYACLNNTSKNKKVIADYLADNEKLVAAALKRDKKQAVTILKSLWEQSLKSIEEALKL